MAGGPVKDSRISGFPKREEGDRARGERQNPCEDDRGIQTAGVGEKANDDGADGEPEVPPESVDAHGRPAGRWGCEIAHRRDVRRVDHRRPEAEEQTCAGPSEEIVPGDEPKEPEGLDPHSRDDQWLPTDPGARGTGHELKEPPADRVKARHEADLLGREPPSDQEQGEQPPGDPVVQVVHEPTLGAREQAPVSPTRIREDGAKRRPGPRSAGLPLRERFRLADEARRQEEARPDRGKPNRKRNGTGIPTIQPTRRIRLRPCRSERYPAVAFAMALTSPKDTRNERIAALEAMPNTWEPRRGSSVRSVPTTEPTKAFTTTKRANCFQFLRRPVSNGESIRPSLAPPPRRTSSPPS